MKQEHKFIENCALLLNKIAFQIGSPPNERGVENYP